MSLRRCRSAGDLVLEVHHFHFWRNIFFSFSFCFPQKLTNHFLLVNVHGVISRLFANRTAIQIETTAFHLEFTRDGVQLADGERAVRIVETNFNRFGQIFFANSIARNLGQTIDPCTASKRRRGAIFAPVPTLHKLDQP
jgi:hypothetical protein